MDKGENVGIQKATSWTDGCGATVATGSIITEMVSGKSVSQAERINKYDFLEALGRLPEENVHYTALAANTLK